MTIAIRRAEVSPETETVVLNNRELDTQAWNPVRFNKYNHVGEVDAHSPAARAGIKTGDRLISINGKRIRDLIDYRFYSSDERVRVEVERSGEGKLTFDIKTGYRPLGLNFAEPAFDGIRVCNNDCPFCFVYRSPRGFRPSIYIKDDDYRYSFLYGGFVTLTNLKEEDWQRIDEQRLGPLYVSIHSTDLDTRRRLLGNSNAPDVLAQLRRLAKMGIDVHTQIVLVPTVNDGDNLKRTVHDLASLYPHVKSIAAVPVGLAGGQGYTGDRRRSAPNRGHGRGFEAGEAMPMRTFQPDEAAKVIQMAENWQRTFQTMHGEPVFYLSDEFYIMAGVKPPPRSHYGAFEQLENGIGLVRQFLDDWRKTAKKLPESLPRPVHASIVTAEMIAPTFAPMVARLNEITNLSVRLIVVKNKAFGETCTVAGLLTGEDVLESLRTIRAAEGSAALGDLLFLPKAMLDKQGWGGRFLDNMTPEMLETTLNAEGQPLHIAMAGLLSQVVTEIATYAANVPAAVCV